VKASHLGISESAGQFLPKAVKCLVSPIESKRRLSTTSEVEISDTSEVRCKDSSRWPLCAASMNCAEENREIVSRVAEHDLTRARQRLLQDPVGIRVYKLKIIHTSGSQLFCGEQY